MSISRFVVSLFVYTVYSATVYGQFFPVPESTVQFKISNDKSFTWKVKSCSVSDFITVREFNEYLTAVKKDSSNAFYKAQLPHSSTMNEKLVKSLLASESLQEEPMPGVSWLSARNYCKWLSEKSKEAGLNFQYDLPQLAEILSFEKFYTENTSKKIASWTINNYFENILDSPQQLFTYRKVSENDPQAMKRFIVYGESFQMDLTSNTGYSFFNYEYIDSSSRFVGFRVVRRFDHLDSVSIDSEVHTNAKIENNRFHGIYQEKYANGQTKVLGEFYYGERIGTWSIWDSTGNLLIQREYEGNKSCTMSLPKTENPYQKLYSEFPTYELKRNRDGYYPYLYVEERSVPFSSVCWRLLTLTNEPFLFENVDMKALVSNLLSSKALWYQYGEKGDFKNQIEENERSNLQSEYQNWDYTRLVVKEDFFFNLDVLMGDTRPISVSFYKNTSDSLPSYMIYYPSARAIIKDFKIDIKQLNKVENLDDLFFFHFYRGEHLYCNTCSSDNLEIDWQREIEILIQEHNEWIRFKR